MNKPGLLLLTVYSGCIKKIYYGVTIIILVLSMPLYGQSRLVYNWGTNEGLVQYSVSTIVQDNKGYIWLGTESGVSRFNGRDFKTFDDSNGFVNSAVKDIVPTEDCVYLLTTLGGLYKVDSDAVTRIDLEVKVYALLSSPDNKEPWLITENGFRRGIHDQNEVLPITENSLSVNIPISTKVNNDIFFIVGHTLFKAKDHVEALAILPEPMEDIFCTPDNQIGVISQSTVYNINPLNGQINVRWKSEDVKLRCVSSAKGRTVLGTSSGEVILMEGGQVSVIKKELPGQSIMTVLVDREKNIWVGLDSGGLWLLPLTSFISYTREDGVGTGDCFYVVADKIRGGVWAGTRNGGIAHIKDQVLKSLNESNGLPSNRVRSLFQSSGGTLFVGLANGIFVMEPSGKTWDFKAEEDTYYQFFYEDSQGAVFCGSQKSELVVWDGGRNIHTVKFNRMFDKLGFTSLVYFNNRYYLGTTRGVYEFTLDDESYCAREIKGPYCDNAHVRNIVADKSGQVWFGTESQGAWVLSKGEWKHLTEKDGFEKQIRFITQTPDGHLLFGGDHGLWSYPNNEKYRFNTAKGLRSNNTFLMNFDPSGKLWVGHNAGLDVIQDGKIIYHFDSRDGLADNELNGNGFAVDSDGCLWFCTMRGISKTDPESMVRDRVKPLIDLSGIEVNDTPVNVEKTEKGLVSEPLKHNQNSVRFHFSGQSFINPVDVRYTYKLEGIDDDWCQPVETGWAYYPKLPPKRYVFRVRCISSDYLQSEIITAVVKIKPAFWQRLSFKLFIAAVICGLIFLVVDLRHRHIRRLNIELERIVEERTRDLAAANDELRRLAITDPMTGLFNRRFFEEKIQSELAGAMRAFHNITKGSKDPFDNAYLAMFMVDLDHFKNVNDTYGHEAGDMVLCAFADSVREVIRSSDTLFRWGGEEFLLLARNTDPESSKILAEKIRVTVEKNVCRYKDYEIAITCSIGFVPYPFDEDMKAKIGWTELISMADQAVYIAKESGRNRWVGVFANDFSQKELEHIDELVNDIIAANNNGFVKLESNKAIKKS